MFWFHSSLKDWFKRAETVQSCNSAAADDDDYGGGGGGDDGSQRHI